MNEQSESILRAFLPTIVDTDNNFIHNDITQFREAVLNFLEQAKGQIREFDRKKMVLTTNTIQNLPKLQQYVYNSLLIFEGHGTVGLLKR